MWRRERCGGMISCKNTTSGLYLKSARQEKFQLITEKVVLQHSEAKWNSQGFQVHLALLILGFVRICSLKKKKLFALYLAACRHHHY